MILESTHRRKIYYDPIYNFHSGYHREIIESTKTSLDWRKESVVNLYEDCIWNEAGLNTQHSLINLGYFSRLPATEVIFSPHIMLTNPNPYFLELEGIEWLFVDRYEEAAKPTQKWKIQIFQQYFIADNLKAIAWYSQTALDNFLYQFSLDYQIDPVIKEKVIQISQVIPPSSSQVRQFNISTESSQFVAVAGKNQCFRKGLDIIEDSFIRLNKEGIREWRLHLVGGATIKANRAYESDQVIEYGHVTPDEVSKVLANNPIFLFLSRADTYGTAVIQAINAQCFVIATEGKRVIATREILEGYPNKILIPNIPTTSAFDDIDKDLVFETLRDIVKSPKPLQPFDNNRYTRDVMKQRILNLVERV